MTVIEIISSDENEYFDAETNEVICIEDNSYLRSDSTQQQEHLENWKAIASSPLKNVVVLSDDESDGQMEPFAVITAPPEHSNSATRPASVLPETRMHMVSSEDTSCGSIEVLQAGRPASERLARSRLSSEISYDEIEVLPPSSAPAPIPEESSDPIDAMSSPLKQVVQRKPVLQPVGDAIDPALEDMLNDAKLTKPKQLKDANRMKRNKEEVLSEISIVVSSVLGDVFDLEQIATLFDPVRATVSNTVEPILRWNRDSECIYYPHRDVFVPCSPRATQEKTVALVYKADELVSELHSEKLAKLLEKHGEDCILIAVGFDSYMARIKNAHNRNYVDKVRNYLEGGSQEQPKRRKKKAAVDLKEYNVEEIRQTLLSFEVRYGTHFFPTRSNQDTLNWIKSLTYTVANGIFDKSNRRPENSNIGSVKSGGTPRESVARSLEQIKNLTSRTSERVADLYGSMAKLVSLAEDGAVTAPDGEKLLRADTERMLIMCLTADEPTAFVS